MPVEQFCNYIMARPTHLIGSL